MATAVLAYTGGIHSAVALHWLQNRKGLKVLTFTGNFGGYANQETVCESALRAGAVGAHIGDLRKLFLLYFAYPALRAQVRIGRGYFLSRSLSRPLLIEEIAKIGRENGCDYITHCAHPNSNDHIRFQTIIQRVCPYLKVLTPWSSRLFNTHRDISDYAKKFNIEPLADKDNRHHQTDKNIWGTCIEFSGEDDPWWEPSGDMYTVTNSPEEAPAKPSYVEIEFQNGNPVGLDSERFEPPLLMEMLNRIGAKAGVGRADMIKDNISGSKTRFLYEAPGPALLYCAHEALENITVPEAMLEFKKIVSSRYARIVNEGDWYEPLRRALDAYVDQTQATVTGTVRVKLYRGNCRAIGVRSDHALYRPSKPTRLPQFTSSSVRRSAADPPEENEK